MRDAIMTEITPGPRNFAKYASMYHIYLSTPFVLERLAKTNSNYR